MNKKKRRKGYQKEVRSKNAYTRLRVGEIELVGEGIGCGEDEKVRDRFLDRPIEIKAKDFKLSDNSTRARVARKYGIVYPKSVPAPPRPEGV